MNLIKKEALREERECYACVVGSGTHICCPHQLHSYAICDCPERVDVSDAGVSHEQQ